MITQLENIVIKGISDNDQNITFETVPILQENITNENEKWTFKQQKRNTVKAQGLAFTVFHR